MRTSTISERLSVVGIIIVIICIIIFALAEVDRRDKANSDAVYITQQDG